MEWIYKKNKALCDKYKSKKIKVCWSWLSRAAEHKGKEFDWFAGILRLLRRSERGRRNSIVEKSDRQIHVPTYFSSNRGAALRVCGWGADNLDDFLTSLEKKGQYERATAIAVFHLDVRRAISSLQRAVAEGGDPTLNLVAIALSGYGGGGGLWKETCLTLQEQFKHPYLRACFSFLCSENNSLTNVLYHYKNDVSLSDRIAFACRFLSDEELMTYVEHMSEHVIETGDLEGIILTGLSKEGVTLLQNYVDNTGDVQSAALIMTNVVPKIFEDPRVDFWLDCYRKLLDMWGLWPQRSMLDVACMEFAERVPNPPPQTYVRCNFCNSPITFGQIKLEKGIPGMFNRSNASNNKKTKISSCPSCNKRLPLCSVCLLPLTCTAPSLRPKENEDLGIYWTEGSASFGEWFTWCQTCRHGGHAKHLIEWFSSHEDCPVTDCPCRCNSIV